MSWAQLAHLLLGKIRHQINLYLGVRRFAPKIAMWIDLEAGFDALQLLVPDASKRLLKVIDIGCNDGTSLMMIRRRLQRFSYKGFDPAPRIECDSSTMEIYNHLLGNSESIVTLYTPEIYGRELTQYSSVNPDTLVANLKRDFPKYSKRFTIHKSVHQMRKLDTFNFEVDFLKVDVEGAELEVFLGAALTIKENLPMILVELNDEESFTKIKSNLEQFGYVCIRSIYRKKSGDVNQIHSWSPKNNNYVFIVPQKYGLGFR